MRGRLRCQKGERHETTGPVGCAFSGGLEFGDNEATPRMSVPRRGRRPARKSFVEFLRSCPVDNLGELIGERDRDTGANREQAFGEGTLA